MASNAATDPSRAGCGRLSEVKQRKLPVGQAERAQGVVELAGNPAGGALHVQTQAAVANFERGGEGYVGL